MDELLTTRQVAAELQVSESSVKRWCDQGVIRTQRTAGGHRRIQRSAMKDFLAVSAAKGVNLTTSPEAIANPSGGAKEHTSLPTNRTISGTTERAQWTGQRENAVPAYLSATRHVAESAQGYSTGVSREQLVERFEQSLMAGDHAACRATVSQWRQSYQGIAQLGDVLISGAMERVGRLWECGRADVFEERRSCEICMQLIHELRQTIPEPAERAPRAIGGTLAGDHYALATQLVELVLREAGWNATNLGGNLPLETVLAAVQKERPRLLWLSISHIANPAQFVDAYNRFYAQLPSDLMVAVGGRALTDDLRPRIGYTAHCDNLEQLSALAQVISGVR